MPFRPFTSIGERVDESIREYAMGVGTITLAWAHLELAIDILIAVDEHIHSGGSIAKHPIGFAAKIGKINKSLKSKRPHMIARQPELVQIVSLGLTAANDRNQITHGALFATLSETEVQLIKLTNVGGNDELSKPHASFHSMFVIFEMIFETTAHTYNVIQQIVSENMPEITEQFEKIGQIDVSRFSWPAVNSRYEEKMAQIKKRPNSKV